MPFEKTENIEHIKMEHARTLDNIKCIGTGEVKLEWNRMLRETVDTTKVKFDESRREDR